jgi:hypothetical protein
MSSLVDGIAWKVKHHRYPLETWQQFLNAWTASVRSGVERACATTKLWYGMRRVRYLRLSRNACHLQFVAIAMNMNQRAQPEPNKGEARVKTRGDQAKHPNPTQKLRDPSH